jgi:hypothetical protein
MPHPIPSPNPVLSLTLVPAISEICLPGEGMFEAPFAPDVSWPCRTATDPDRACPHAICDGDTPGLNRGPLPLSRFPTVCN